MKKNKREQRTVVRNIKQVAGWQMEPKRLFALNRDVLNTPDKR